MGEAALAFARRLMIGFDPVAQPGTGFGEKCSARAIPSRSVRLRRPLDDYDVTTNAEVGNEKANFRDRMAQVQRMENDPVQSGQDEATIGRQRTDQNTLAERNSGTAEN